MGTCAGAVALVTFNRVTLIGTSSTLLNGSDDFESHTPGSDDHKCGHQPESKKEKA